MKPQHTLLPWTRAIADNKKYDVHICELRTGKLVASVIRTTPGIEGDANGEFIVRAVNSHEALLNAVKNVVWKLSHDHSASGKGDDCKPATINRNDAVVELCREAIKQAEGK